MFVIWLLVITSGCSKPSRPKPAAAVPAAAQASSAPAAPAAPAEQIAGAIFNVPVPIGNYAFAKRVSYMFPRPWEERLSGEERERAIWEALILHYESFRRGIEVSDEEMERRIDSVLKDQKQSFARAGDPAAYAAWVKDALGEEVAHFENQMRYLYQIDKLRDQVRDSLPVTNTEPELQDEFLSERHHVGGDYVLFDSQAEAEAFYGAMTAPGTWEAAKAKDPNFSKPFGLITVQAIIDLWSVPKVQAFAFHALPLGTVAPPMPFGTKQWGVFRLLEKRTGDLAEFAPQRAAYDAKLTAKKRYVGLQQWIKAFVASAHLTISTNNHQ